MSNTIRPQPFPEILAVREDRSRHAQRTGGSPCSSDILSVYLEGGPRYCLGESLYEFTPPVALLVPTDTIDADKQEGQVCGVFALFHGQGLLRRTRKNADWILVRLGAACARVPQLKQLARADAEAIAALLREMTPLMGTSVTEQLRRTALLLQAVNRYCEAKPRIGPSGIHREAVRLRQLIEAWAFENTPLERVYHELDISAAHAATIFRRAFGISPVAYRNQLRLQRARQLLVATTRNVAQTAYAVGYTDPLYFSRVFRQTFGVTPSSLIRQFDSTRK